MLSPLLFNKINFKIKMQIRVFEMSRAIENNDLHASDGRDTEALNCKPTTNLKEISELSNYCKTSGFRLHAVMRRALLWFLNSVF
jgi:hypothetical protein